MKILGLDTATSTAGIAIVDDDRVLAEARHDTAGRGADLLIAIDALCRGAGIAPAALDAVAIGAGPGSFTGLRIGMATAKGIAFAAGRPLWAVSSLAALADDAQRVLDEDTRAHAIGRGLAGDPRTEVVICAALDARRGEVFAGCFSGGVLLAPERVIAPEELATWAAQIGSAGASAAIVPAPITDRAPTPAAATAAARPGPEANTRGSLVFAGDAIATHPALAALEACWLAVRTPSGRAVARLALAGARVDITLGGAPTYIRLSEAEVKYPDGVPGALRRR